MKIKDCGFPGGRWGATVITGMEGDKSFRDILLRSWNPTLKGMIGGIVFIIHWAVVRL